MNIDFDSKNFGKKLNKQEKIDMLKKIFCDEDFVLNSLNNGDYCLNSDNELVVGFLTKGGNHKQISYGFWDNGLRVVDNYTWQEIESFMNVDFQKRYVKEMFLKFGEEFAVFYVNLINGQKQKLQQEFEEKQKAIDEQLEFLK